jgi:hypothetical protein
MADRSSIFYLSRFGIVLAIIYCIPVIVFLEAHTFSDIWLLYLGSALFLVFSCAFGIIYGSKNKNNPRIKYNGFTVAILGVIFSCILVLLLTLILAPDIYGIGSPYIFQETPPAIGKNWTGRVLFIMLADAIIVNFAAGTFSAVMAKGKNEENKLPPNE